MGLYIYTKYKIINQSPKRNNIQLIGKNRRCLITRLKMLHQKKCKLKKINCLPSLFFLYLFFFILSKKKKRSYNKITPLLYNIKKIIVSEL